VVVLANYFYRDTVMLANHLTEPHGIRLADRECGQLLCDLQCGRHGTPIGRKKRHTSSCSSTNPLGENGQAHHILCIRRVLDRSWKDKHTLLP
jgi:hypothetical protein